jgi:hypothetical protein
VETNFEILFDSQWKESEYFIDKKKLKKLCDETMRVAYLKTRIVNSIEISSSLFVLEIQRTSDDYFRLLCVEWLKSLNLLFEDLTL